MKTFKQFKEDNQYVSEGVGALIGTGLKLGGKALAAYSAYNATKNLAKGNYGKAALDTVGVIPGGRVFKGIRKLGGAKNLAKLGSATQSTARLNITGKTPNTFARGVDKAFDKSVEYGGKLIKKIRGK